ncbi:MAG: GIY-YIG nuclease family protein [Candidatus Eremiobacteraeota bacterium]|nr:GIY-YIG nuclease family protein [Candidatus Eremiobacteraeota bacterium]
MKTYFVYMLSCADGSFYVGITNNMERRLAQHSLGLDRRCYTFTRRPVTLVHSSNFCNVDDAIAWEKQLKGWTRAKKLALIENDWPRISELAQNYAQRFADENRDDAFPRCHPSTGSG